MRTWGRHLLLALCVACAPTAPTRAPIASRSSPLPSQPPPPPQSSQAPPPAAPTSATPPQPIGPRVVLHAGDSMVGGNGGLSRALEAKFKAFGTTYVRDWRVATVQTFDYADHFGKLIDRHHPDLVILNLGANDVFVPNPSALARFVRSIARKASGDGRTCYWITPPLWKPPDTGIIAVIKEHATGCRVFDSSAIVLPKWPDGIHPNNEGGAIWAEKFWAFYEATQSPG